MRYIEIAGRTHPLRFTARALLRTQQLCPAPLRTLFTSGEEGARWLLYCALCDAYPFLTRRKSDALFDTLLPDIAPLYDELAQAYDMSGFPREGITQEEMDRLLDAAARAGMKDSRRLLDLSYREIARELDAHLPPRSRADAPMTEAQMLSALKNYARRFTHADA